MYENLLGQDSVKNLLEKDIKNGTLPGSVLFYGNEGNGKLTAALETARILSHKDVNADVWQCQCPSCMHHKSLTASNMLLCGPRECFLEISASLDTFMRAYAVNNSHVYAGRYLFIRAVRKLTLRFSPILLAGDDKLNKIAALTSEIDENLEKIDFPRPLPPFEETQKICEEIRLACEKLESGFLYSSIPVAQIRNLEEWARITTDENKKTIIIENADRMNDAARNALLKILEEPPENTVFILLTNRRNAVMPTILSRVRTYSFATRSLKEQKDVLLRAFHTDKSGISINDYLKSFLPITPDDLLGEAKAFISGISSGAYPDIQAVTKRCGNFVPKVELKLFLTKILQVLRPLLSSPQGAEAYAQVAQEIQSTYNHVNLYNQSVVSSLELLLRNLTRINVSNGNIFRCSVM